MLNIPSITAHLLHHKQTIFQGTFDYKIKSNGSRPDSEIMYECDYEFKEKSVEALSEDINTFCINSLKEIYDNRDQKNIDSDSCSYDETDLFSGQMNEKLIEHFEDSLSAFENREEKALDTPRTNSAEDKALHR